MTEPEARIAQPLTGTPVLVVDDEKLLAEAIARKLRASGLEADTANDAKTALEQMEKRAYRLVVMDIAMPGMSGLEALELVKERHPGCEVIMMTGNSTVDIAVEAMKKGAFEFLQKPFESLDRVLLLVRRALERSSLRAENESLRSRLAARPSGLVGTSAAMRALGDMVPDLARSMAPVLIEGESGTGKEVLARAIHDASPRATKPFVPVNCGAIPETVLESELFGHEKGAFTGAVSTTRGLFRAAEGGTLFLDEIGEVPVAMQVKLLRALQEQEVRAVGSTVTTKIDVRVISATNRDLKARIVEGRFREDLYYRLAVVPVRLPALRARSEDVPLLVRHFVRKLNAEEHKFDEIDADAMDRLSAWSWPGNVRELENAIERAFALGKGGRLTVGHLPADIRGSEGSADGGTKAQEPGLSNLPLSLEAYERCALERALSEGGGDAGKAAALLGIPRSTFYRRLQKLKPETAPVVR